MSVFVVVTESYYGGEDEVMVFNRWEKAEKYVQTLNEDAIVIEAKYPTDREVIYITVTEENYGGGDEKIKIFSSLHQAEEYVNNIHDSKYDVLILERFIQK